jgi:hypothetical protein
VSASGASRAYRVPPKEGAAAPELGGSDGAYEAGVSARPRRRGTKGDRGWAMCHSRTKGAPPAAIRERGVRSGGVRVDILGFFH